VATQKSKQHKNPPIQQAQGRLYTGVVLLQLVYKHPKIALAIGVTVFGLEFGVLPRNDGLP